MAGLYAAAKGEKAWPPLAMFKALLLATWYDLSDVRLAEALFDRASFRRLLAGQGLDCSLFAAITRDLERKGATIRKGSLIDATVIGSASKATKRPLGQNTKAARLRMAIRRILPR